MQIGAARLRGELMSWRSLVRDQFCSRSELSSSELMREYQIASEEDLESVRKALSVFHEEYGIKPGWLRASDELKVFIDPPKERNPFRWLFTRAAYEDALGEVRFHLSCQVKQRGSPLSRFPETVGEYAAAWRG